MSGNDGIRAVFQGNRRRSWATGALLALGGWLVVSPLVLSTTRVTAGMVSAVGSGLALLVLAGWARAARNPVPPLAIAMSFGLWLLVAPSMWDFRDGVDAWELVPVPSWEVTEPTRAAIARAEWSSILAGLLTLALAGWVLAAARRRGRPASGAAGSEHPSQAEAAGVRRLQRSRGRIRRRPARGRGATGPPRRPPPRTRRLPTPIGRPWRGGSAATLATWCGWRSGRPS